MQLKCTMNELLILFYWRAEITNVQGSRKRGLNSNVNKLLGPGLPHFSLLSIRPGFTIVRGFYHCRLLSYYTHPPPPYRLSRQTGFLDLFERRKGLSALIAGL